MKAKKFIWIWVGLVFFMCTGLKVKAEEGKLIYFVYDNSDSMRVVDLDNKEAPRGTPRDWGTKAQYAVKAFCAMSNPEDEIKFYRIDNEIARETESEGEWPKPNHKETKDYREEYISLVDEIYFDGTVTLYGQIETAIKEIKDRVFQGEKWVIVFTDGEIKEYDTDGSKNLNDRLISDLKESDINLYFVSLNPEKSEENRVETKGNITAYYLSDEEKSTILQSILKVTEEIYGKRRFPENRIVENSDGNNRILSIDFGIPVSDVMVILQTEAEENEKLEIAFKECLPGSEKFNITSIAKYHENNSLINVDGSWIYGVVAKCDNFLKKNGNSYTLNIEIPEKTQEYAVYYTPAVYPQIFINQEQDKVREGNYVEGEYTLGIELVNSETKEVIESGSELLKEEEVSFQINGNSYTQSIAKVMPLELSAGEVIVEADTTLGITEPLQITVRENPEKFRLDAKIDKDKFYYNRLEQKENVITVRLINGERNISNLLKKEKVNITFFQEDKKIPNLIYDIQYDSAKQAMLVYPLLKDDNRNLTGDITCYITVPVEIDYYEKAFEYEEEIILPMVVEENLFEVKIEKDKIESKKYGIKNWQLLIPFYSRKIPIEYSWNGKVLNWKEVDEISTTLKIEYPGNSTEELNIPDKPAVIEGKWNYFFDFPNKVGIITKASYTAFGITDTKEDLYEIVLDDIVWTERMIVIIGLIVILIAIGIAINNVLKLIEWSIREKKIICIAPEVFSSFIGSSINKRQKVKTVYKNRIIFLDYSFEVLVNIHQKEQEKKLVLEIVTGKYTYRIRIKEGEKEWSLSQNGQIITQEFEEFSRNMTEFYLDVQDGNPQVINIRFGGEK